MVFRTILISFIITTHSFILTACSNVPKKTDNDTNNTDIAKDSKSLTNAGYTSWHNNVIESHKVINANKKTIETSYNTINNFDKKLITTGWLDEVSTIMTKNDVYRQSILNSAGDDKIGFVKNLLENPKNAIYQDGASEALVTGLKHIENFDYQYRVLSNAFEDSARGRSYKTLSNPKNINAITLKYYTSKNNTPSVAEQLLTAAAIKILNFHNNETIKTAYQQMLSNSPIESCLGNAQRNSAQCKAASYDKNDLSFCMAKHAITETSNCFSWILP